MKIYIVGSVASGKSTLARKISHITGAPCYHLDETVYTVDPSEPWGNKKRPLEERDRLFQAMLAQRHYIMEDAGRDCFRAGMEQADTVLLLEIPPSSGKSASSCAGSSKTWAWKSVFTALALPCSKPCSAGPGITTGADGTKALVSQFASKTIVLRNGKDIQRYLETLSRVDE